MLTPQVQEIQKVQTPYFSLGNIATYLYKILKFIKISRSIIIEETSELLSAILSPALN